MFTFSFQSNSTILIGMTSTFNILECLVIIWEENEKITQTFRWYMDRKLSEIHFSSVFVVTCYIIDLLKDIAVDQSQHAILDSLLWRMFWGCAQCCGIPCTMWCVVRQLLRSVLELEFITGVSKLHNQLGITIFRRFYGPVKENDLGNCER